MERKLIVLLSAMIFFLLPWYYTDSGLPQPVDAAILLLFISFFMLRFPNLKEYLQHSDVLKSFLWFSLYVTIILLINFIINAEEITLFLTIQNAYFILLVTVFLCMLCYFKNNYHFEDYYDLILKFLLIDTIIPLLFLFKTGLGLTRIGLSFNNENQLGFYTLVNLSIFFYLSLMAREHGCKTKKILSLLILNINLLFLFLSASRACYPIIILYVLSYPLLFKINLRGYSRLILWTIGTIFVFLSISYITYKLYLHMMDIRRAMNPTDYAGLFGDFYFRALRGVSDSFSNTWYFLFGNGTYSNSIRGRLEYHNNFLATLNMVGFFGLLLYGYMNILIVKNLFKKGFYYLIPYLCYLFYSMLHYSYRTRVNWILLVMFIFIVMDMTKHRMTYHKGKVS